MTLLDKLHKRFAIKDICNLNNGMNMDDWNNYLASFPEPKDSIESAYFKYLCRNKYFSFGKRMIYNFVGFVFDLFAVVSTIIPFRDVNNHPLPNKAVLEKHTEVGYEDVIPEELLSRYNVQVIENCSLKIGILTKNSKRVFFEVIRRYPREFFFHYFVYKELVAHCFFLRKYNPEAVIVYVNERNVASPILTELYKKNGRKFISFMHGERVFELFEAFLEFSEFYVWDRWYIDFYRDMNRSKTEKYIVYTPLKLRKHWNIDSIQPSHKYTVYYGSEPIKALIKFKEMFDYLNKRNIICKIRPHPRDIATRSVIYKLFDKKYIEDPNTISLEESLSCTEYAIGLQTTVLYQALCEGRKVLIDDITNPEIYSNLRERKYRIFSEDLFSKCELLSQIKDYNW